MADQGSEQTDKTERDSGDELESDSKAGDVTVLEEDDELAEQIQEQLRIQEQEQGLLQSLAPLHDDSVQGFFDHTDAVLAVAVHPVQTLVVSGSQDEKAIVWDFTDGEEKFQLAGHPDSITKVAFSNDGRFIGTACMDGSVRIFDAASGKLLQTLEGPSEEIEWMMWHPKGPVVAAGSADGTAWMWNAVSGQCMQVFAGHTGSCMAGGFPPDGKTLVTSDEEGSLHVWDPKSGKSVLVVKGGSNMFHEGPVGCISFHPDPAQPLALTGSADGFSCLVQLSSGKVLKRLKVDESGVEAVGFSSKFPWMAVSGLSGVIQVWDVGSGQQRCAFKHSDGVIKLVWSKDSSVLYSCSLDKTVRMWDARDGKCLSVWRGHQDTVLDFAVHRNLKRLVSVSDDRTCLVFNTEEMNYDAEKEAEREAAAAAEAEAAAKAEAEDDVDEDAGVSAAAVTEPQPDPTAQP